MQNIFLSVQLFYYFMHTFNYIIIYRKFDLSKNHVVIFTFGIFCRILTVNLFYKQHVNFLVNIVNIYTNRIRLKHKKAKTGVIDFYRIC